MRRTVYHIYYRLLAGLLIVIMLLGSIGEVSYAAEIADNPLQQIEEIEEQEEEIVSQSEDVTILEENGEVTDSIADDDESSDDNIQESEQVQDPAEKELPENVVETITPEKELPENVETITPEEELLENVEPEISEEDVSIQEEENSNPDEIVSEQPVSINADENAEMTESTETEEILVTTVDFSDSILQEGGFLTEESVLVDSSVSLFSLNENSVTTEIAAIILNAYENYIQEIDLSSYQITMDEFTPIITNVFNANPRLFYVKGEYTPYYNVNTGYITKVVLSYYYDKATTEDMQDEFDDAIALALSGAESTWSDLEKALYLNDYLTRNCKYDLDFANYSAYNALVDREAVCQGYALAYSILAEELGLECEVVSSFSLNHAWNMVVVNDEIYNVDTTWNDQIPDFPGVTSYTYFMKSTAYFESEDANHCEEQDWLVTGGWGADYAYDTSYDTYFWNNLGTGFEYLDGYWYGFDGLEEIVKYTCDGTTLSKCETVLTITDIWYVSATTYYENKFVGIGSYNGLLYYSTDDEIYTWNPVTNAINRVFVVPEDEREHGNIYGMGVLSSGEIYIYQKNVEEMVTIIKRVTDAIQGEQGYHVRFNGNGATEGAMENLMNRVHDTVYTLPANGFKRAGYTFTGWNTKADGSGTSYANQAEIKNLSESNGATVTLYAQWEKVKYAILYDLTSGTNNSANPSEYYVTSETITLKNPTRLGYTFAGWYSDMSLTKKVTGIPAGSTGDKKFYASWKANTYTVKYDGNGATGGTMSAQSGLKYNTEYNLTPNAYQKRGYKFVQWNINADGSGFRTYEDNASVKNLTAVNGGAITLYAQWEKVRYTITYNLNGGTNSSNPAAYYVTSAAITLKNPTRKGYTFAGWYSDSAYTKKVTTISKGSVGNKTLYAKWTVNKYNVQFNGNGATSGKMNNKTGLRYNTAYALTANAYKRKGYTFTGWNTKADGSGTTYKNKAEIKNLTATNGRTVTLYAQWKKAKYTITYNLKGGTNNKSNPSAYYVTSATITLKNPTRKGYTFAGWYSDSACTKKVTTISKGSVGNKTLYAKWTINKYNIQFNGNGATSGKMSNKTGLKYNTAYTLTANAYKRKGYVFTGWNTKADGSGTTYKNKAEIKNLTTANGKTVTLYAQWRLPYINATSRTLYVGGTYNLKLVGTTIQSVTTSNKSIATVSKAGVVTAKTPGRVTITLKGANGKSYKCVVTVKEQEVLE